MTGNGTISVERIGRFRWEWTARGRLTRVMETRTSIFLPSHHEIQVGWGTAFTRRGALRKGRRLIAYYCAPSRREVVDA